MKLDQFTEKAQAAVLDARDVASEYSHAQIEPEHILLALLRQEDGVVPQLITRIAGDFQPLYDEVEASLAARPKVYGSNASVTLSRAASDVLSAAEREAKAMKDEYVSTEHILLALERILRNYAS